MAAKPTIDPPGPMGWTSTIRTAAVHAAKASSNPAPKIKFLFFNEMSSCKGIRLSPDNTLQEDLFIRKKPVVTFVTRFVS
jgi:hypothetical protein